jgi:hypothetical protein
MSLALGCADRTRARMGHGWSICQPSEAVAALIDAHASVPCVGWAVSRVASAQRAESRPEPCDGALLAPVGAVRAESVSAALVGDGLVAMAARAGEHTEGGTAVADFLRKGYRV